MVIATSDGQIYESETHMAVEQPMEVGYKPPPAPANDNKNLQIPSDPYLDAVLQKQWDDMVKAGRKPVLQIIPGDKKTDSEEYQVAGDVVPLPINPFAGSDRRSTKEEAAQFSVGDRRGSDPKIRSIGTNTVLDWVERAKAARGVKDK